MNNFLLGLQFLTRITIKKNLDWSEKACGGSVKFFPLIGAILGIIYVLVGYVIYYLLPSFNIYLSAHLIGFILLFCNIFLTGALHCDGFTDTMDGILSGRKRERILEIMKDSRVGAHGATCLILVLIGKYSMFTDLMVNQNSARKHVGNRFEELIRVIFTEISVSNKRTVLQIPYETDEGQKIYKCENDLIISPFENVESTNKHLDENEIVVSIKTTSKDRMGKVKQRPKEQGQHKLLSYV